VWAGHLAVVEGDCGGAIEVETDRARFLGRGHGLRAPLAVIDGRALSNSVGTVLDPIFALRRRVRIAPGATVRIAFWTLLAESRDGLLASIDRHRDGAAFARAATLAWTQAQVELHHLGVTPAEAGLFQRLASHILYAAPGLRAGTEAILRGIGPQSGLWPLGISGDRPLILVRVAETDHLGLVREVLLAHEYWRMKRFAVDLVIVNDHPQSYVEGVQSGLDALIRAVRSGRADEEGTAGRVFAFRADQISPETLALLGAVARVVLIAGRGGLFDQLDRRAETRPLDGQRNRVRPRPAAGPAPLPETFPRVPTGAGLEFFNGLGGFAREGREYVTILGPGQSTPAPWVNVIANPHFGFLVSAEGGGYSWALNSRDNQLTPWSNDPVGDPPGEVFFLRDDESGRLWSPTALPIRDPAGVYVARHGWGYSRFEHAAQGIEATLSQSVAPDDPVKLSRLVLHNRSGRRRGLAVTAYVEWVLGPSRPATLAFVSTEIDPVTGAMFARNPWRLSGGGRVAFADWRGGQTDWTGDRAEFIGRNGVLANPAALAAGQPLSNRTGAGLDPCGALRTRVVLPIDGRVELVFLLGEAADADSARDLIRRFRVDSPDRLEAETARRWDDVLGRVQVRTPDRAMDILLNGWLLYQTLSCRVWARSAFYQASGAYGFRDQLQDGMALASVCPDETRAHLLRAAGRQFPEGDVQHWWLPGSGQGIRGHISDDRVWLAIAVAHYVAVTGDDQLLDQRVPFIEGTGSPDAAQEAFFVPTVSERDASVFEHCALALDSALTWGAHGLPLIGTGDWNDGMNRVGAGGVGESVWLGWLLYAALHAFAPLAERRGLADRADHWREQAETLLESLERDGWDGDWYRRGFFDDGSPLGSQVCAQCRIDQIAQSWAVLSGGAEFGRGLKAMAAVERHLVRGGDRLALLFTPPFDHGLPDPGYIQAYPPGIRENGGQYTHAALWSVMAFAALGEGDRAAGLFSLLNPINHARTRAEVLCYKVEPYVVAADVYAHPSHLGRGGWTWYSGSSGWMQRAGLESILGVRLAAGSLYLDPCLPKDWRRVDLTLRYGAARYEILVDNREGIGRGVVFAALDGREVVVRPLQLVLVNDGAPHRLDVRIG
jgi:cyclic beta-1,2-glucan synthetase